MKIKKEQLLVSLLIGLTLGQAQAVKIGVSYDFGGKQDRGFNASAAKGLQRVQQVTHIESIEGVADEATKTYKVSELAKAGADLVIGIGFSQQTAIESAAKAFPNRHFAIVDGSAKGDNVASISFREEEGSYLVGYLAGLNSSTGVVGFIGGMDVPLIHKFQAGYEAGAKAANPKVKVIAQYVGTTPDAWSNPAKAKEIAASMRGRGADIVFAAAGGSGNGLIDYVKQTQCLKANQLPAGVKFTSDNFKNVPKSASYKAACAGDSRPMFFIGVDANQNYLGDFDKNPATLNHGLTSMLKRVDSAVFVLGQRAAQGNYSSGELSFGLKERGVGYALDAYNKALISANQVEQLQTIMSMISAGNLEIPTK